ncbi:MAG: hypothetical protein K9M03_03710 [Kiritimatiellales bacterium]|nr:hypothetical protein [Kiritimatiellales bacterium]
MINKTIQHLSTFVASWNFTITRVFAEGDTVYSGDGISAGVSQAAETGVGTELDLKVVIGDIVDQALTFVTILAVTVIIIAGFYLILGLGNDTSRETAKKIVIYVAVGILVIVLSKAFVEFIKTLGGL